MKVNFTKVNPEIEITKRQIQSSMQQATVKLDTGRYSNVIMPIVPVHLSKQLIYNNTNLEKCIRLLSQDVILNEYAFTSEKEEDDTLVDDFWDKSKYELYKAVQEYYGYGFGACEVTRTNDGKLKKLVQIPAETLLIKQESYHDENGETQYSYYAYQQLGEKRIKMRLTRFQYTEEDWDLPECLWLGGGKTSEFYEIPYWITAINKITAKIALEELDAKKINEGNLSSGILSVVRPPMTKKDESVEDTVKGQMQNAGTGIMILELKAFEKELPLEVNYIPITEGNYDYLQSLAEKCDAEVLKCFAMPKVRLMIDDVTESMNSNKSDTIFQIYSIQVDTEQMPFENEINQFNKKYFKYFGKVDIKVPIFGDKTQIEIETILLLFNNGIFTLGQTIDAVQKYYPNMDLSIPPSNPMYHERYYNGNLLGIDSIPEPSDENPTGMTQIKNMGDLVAYIEQN